jgi:uncharacterized membrane protein YtjA (UPF0391 family)
MHLKGAIAALLLAIIAALLAWGGIIPEPGIAASLAAVAFIIAMVAFLILGGLGTVPRSPR